MYIFVLSFFYNPDISGDVNLTLKEPPKLLYQECEGNFVTAPLKVLIEFVVYW